LQKSWLRRKFYGEELSGPSEEPFQLAETQATSAANGPEDGD